ncbi:DMT family transporter [bacterium]|nr:DMT family transporter [bacterium]
MQRQKQFGILSALIAALLFGAATPLSKPLLTALTDLQLAGLLYLGAALGVVVFLIRERSFQVPWKMPRQDALRLSGAILFGGILGPVFLLAGLRLAAAASVSLWLNMEMVATVLLGYFLFKDQLSGRSWLASVGMLGAALLLAWDGGIAGFRAGALVALACLCWGIDNHLTALIDGISPAQSTFWKGLAAGGVNLLLGTLLAPMALTLPTLVSALGLGALSYGLSILLYITSAQSLGATRSQMIFSSAPFFGLLISFLLGERLSILQWTAMALFLGSAYLLFRETHSHDHAHESLTHVHTHFHPDEHHPHPHPEGLPALGRHSHEHSHTKLQHSHPHWPDLHHRHEHG